MEDTVKPEPEPMVTNFCINCCQAVEPPLVNRQHGSFLPNNDSDSLSSSVPNTATTTTTATTESSESENPTLLISNVLMSIYKLDCLKSCPEFGTTADMEEVNWILCNECANILSKLHKLHEDFNNLRDFDSFLSQEIRKLNECLQKHHHDNSQLQQLAISAGGGINMTSRHGHGHGLFGDVVVKTEIEHYDQLGHQFDDDGGGGMDFGHYDDDDDNRYDPLASPSSQLENYGSSELTTPIIRDYRNLRNVKAGPWVLLKRLKDHEIPDHCKNYNNYKIHRTPSRKNKRSKNIVVGLPAEDGDEYVPTTKKRTKVSKSKSTSRSKSGKSKSTKSVKSARSSSSSTRSRPSRRKVKAEITIDDDDDDNDDIVEVLDPPATVKEEKKGRKTKNSSDTTTTTTTSENSTTIATEEVKKEVKKRRKGKKPKKLNWSQAKRGGRPYIPKPVKPRPKKPKPVKKPDPNTSKKVFQEDENENHRALKRRREHHYRRRKLKLPNPCWYCELYFDTQAECCAHTREVHAEGDEDAVICDQCSFMPKSASAINAHKMYQCQQLKPGQLLDPIPCTFENCEKNFSSRRTLAIHIKQSHGEVVLTCPKKDSDDCKFKTTNPTSLRSHIINKHEKTDPVECPECGKIFKNEISYQAHYTNLHTEDGHARYLSYLVKNQEKQKVRRAKRREKREEDHICTECEPNVNCFTHFALIFHRKKFHSGSIKNFTYVCESCGTGFTGHSSYRYHVEFVHSDEKTQLCTHCGKSFKNTANLNDHVRRTHSEEGRLRYNALMRRHNQRRKLREQALAAAKEGRALDNLPTSSSSQSKKRRSQDNNNDNDNNSSSDVNSNSMPENLSQSVIHRHDTQQQQQLPPPTQPLLQPHLPHPHHQQQQQAPPPEQLAAVDFNNFMTLDFLNSLSNKFGGPDGSR